MKNNKLNIVFLGTGAIAAQLLRTISSLPFVDLKCIITKADTIKHRGKKLVPSEVKNFASLNLSEIKLLNVELKEINALKLNLESFYADIFFVVDFGVILSDNFLNIPKLFSINFHPSLLPKYRGPNPIRPTLYNGEDKTGITFIKMNNRMDAGDILLQKSLQIKEEDNYGTLLEKLIKMGQKECISLLSSIYEGKESNFIPQNDDIATYTKKLSKKDARIDWNWDADAILRLIRSLSPNPGAFTFLDNKRIKILQASTSTNPSKNNYPVGTIIDDNLTVTTNNGYIKIEHLQIEGKRSVSAQDFLIGHRDTKFKIFSS